MAEDTPYLAVVVGSGPAGLAVVGNLLEKHGSGKILWVDRHFHGGRICRNYREVSSNTRVKLILTYARALEPFQRVIDATPAPNAITTLEKLDQNAGCRLELAADMFLMLNNGILNVDQVDGMVGVVVSANYSKELALWSTAIQTGITGPGDGVREVSSRSLILCTGSSPSTLNLSMPNFTYHKLELDTALSPSRLASALTKDRHNITVGVVGSSHSAITVLMNLFHLASSPPASMAPLRVKWFSRRPLIYAQHLADGRIMHDNTGLKGVAAQFARENLENDALRLSPVGHVVEKIDCASDERGAYQWHLPSCTHVVQAVGFVRDPLPPLTRDGESLEHQLSYDHQGGGFEDAQGRKIRGLYGAGIAFPEMVTDPSGDVELAVGFWKFMRYLKGVVPVWETF